MQAFKKVFSAPTYPDEEVNRRAGLLSFTLNLHILEALSTSLVFILFLKMPPIFPLAAFLSSLPGFGLRATLWRGYVKQSSIIFASMVILIMPLLAWFTGYSVATVPVTVFQCISVLMAGLILGRWGAATFVLSTGAINGILIYAELQGIYFTYTTHTPQESQQGRPPQPKRPAVKRVDRHRARIVNYGLHLPAGRQCASRCHFAGFVRLPAPWSWVTSSSLPTTSAWRICAGHSTST